MILGLWPRLKMTLIFAFAAIGFAYPTPTISADIGRFLDTETGDVSLSLNEDATASAVLIEGRTVRIVGTAELGTPIVTTADDPMFIVGKGGRLILEDVALQAAGPGTTQGATTAILVEGGALELRDCSYEGTATFAVYARGGSVAAAACGMQDGVNGLAVFEGAELILQGTSFYNFSETAVILADADTKATLDGTRISHAVRGISVSDGATLNAAKSEFSAVSDVALFAKSAAVTLDGFDISTSPKFGIYVDGESAVELRNGQITGQIDTAIKLLGSDAAVLSDLAITGARIGVAVATASRDVEISNLRASTQTIDAVHVVADGGSLLVEDSVLLGASTGIWITAGGTLSLENSLIAGPQRAGIVFTGSQSEADALNVLWSRFLISAEAVAVHAEAAKISFIGNLLRYQKTALSGAAFANGQVENNALVGPVENAVWATGSEANVPRWSNTIVAADLDSVAGRGPQLSVAFQPNLSDVAADSAALGQGFDGLQAQIGFMPTAFDMQTIVLADGRLKPAPYAKLFDLVRLDAAGGHERLGGVFASDMPLRVPPGTYRFEQQNGRATLATVSQFDTYELLLDPPSTPYALGVLEGALTAGFALELRPPSDSRALWQNRWPGYPGLVTSDKRGYPILKINASADDIAGARAFALEQIKKHVAALKLIAAGATYADAADAKRYNAAWTALPTALDILLVTGRKADAKVLADVVAAMPDSILTNGLASEFARASALISLRLGMIETSPTVDVWQNLQATPYARARTKLGIALGRVGFQPAVDALIKVLAIERKLLDASPFSDGNAAFELIAQAEHPAVLALVKELLQAFDRFAMANLLEQKADPHFVGINVSGALPTALGYANAYLPADERTALVVGIPPWKSLNGALLAEPENMIDHFLGISAAAYVAQNNHTLMGLPCTFYGDLKGAERDRIEGQYVRLLAKLVAQFGDDRPDAFAEIHNAVGKSRCSVSSEALKTLKSPEGNATEFFPTWMRFGYGAPGAFLPDLAAQGDLEIAERATLARYSDDTLNAALGDAAIAESPAVKAYNIFRTVADPSGVGNPGPFLGQNDVRFFLESLEDPRSFTLWLGAKVTLAPRMAGGRTFFGVSIDTAAGDLGGLAGMINNNAAKMAERTANFGRSLIEKVVLRNDEGAGELAFVKTTESGTHVFELTESNGSNAGLYIDVYFQGYDRGWTLSFPLFASPFGFQQIQEFGQIKLLN